MWIIHTGIQIEPILSPLIIVLSQIGFLINVVVVVSLTVWTMHQITVLLICL